MDGIRIELDYAAIEKLEKAVLRAVEETVDELRSDVVKEQVMPYGGLWLEPWQPGGRRETFAQDKFAELYKEEAKL